MDLSVVGPSHEADNADTWMEYRRDPAPNRHERLSPQRHKQNLPMKNIKFE
jgi:hypothetical protein